MADEGSGIKSSLRVLIEGSLFVALAFVLSFIKIWRLPQGGEISLEMTPLIIFSLLRGAVAGIAAGVIFGLIHFLQSPMIIHPIQFLLDYPLAFGAVGLAGLFAGSRPDTLKIWLSVSLSITGRLFFHVLSGCLFIELLLKRDVQNPFVYSLLYNGSYLIPDLIICSVAVRLLLPRLQRYDTASRG